MPTSRLDFFQSSSNAHNSREAEKLKVTESRIGESPDRMLAYSLLSLSKVLTLKFNVDFDIIREWWEVIDSSEVRF